MIFGAGEGQAVQLGKFDDMSDERFKAEVQRLTGRWVAAQGEGQ